jgi:hypothetical protein
VPPFRRTLVAGAVAGDDGIVVSTARLDDYFHAFEAAFHVRDGEVVGASAAAYRTPWATCPGAVASVAALRGPAADVGQRLVGTDRSHTCVHLTDTAWLASRMHARREYELTATREGAHLRRDGEAALEWPLRGWLVAAPGPFEGMSPTDKRWAAVLDEIGAGDELREAVRVMRRGLLVAIGYWELDWAAFATAADAGGPNMLGTCHTYTEPQLSRSVRTARVPPR